MRHDIAKRVISEYADKMTSEMANKILDGFSGEVGFNPGSQIVQIVGVTFLDRMDHFIKERLLIEFYERYMDDFILINDKEGYLKECKERINNELSDICLNFNPSKTRIYKIKDGIPFLGFNFYLKDSGKVVILVRPEKIKRERKKLRRMSVMVKDGRLSKTEFYQHFRDVKACLKFGNNFKVIHNLNEYVKNLMEE